jgi:DNA polymerase elongation subunit (family B)/DNA-directed RNA polymerase subunit RPC12/RpoP
MKHNGPKILILDIETSPIIAHVWGLWDQTVSLNQIKNDWHVLSWSAKWLHSKEVMYQDQRHAKRIEEDKELLKGIWKLLDEADIIITQNGKAFDQKRLNARFILNGMKPPSSYKHIDTKQIASRNFGFTSNKLEYLTDKLCTKHKKLKSKKFQGFELWRQCLAGNVEAWDEMKRYNIRDVLSLEELYRKLAPWDNSINMALYHDKPAMVCSCGSKIFNKNGFAYTSLGKFQRYTCAKCGAESRSGKNEFSKEKRESLTRRTSKH